MGHDVYLCHAPADADLAARVARALAREGIRCRLPSQAEAPATEVADTVRAVAASEAVVLLWTDAAAISPTVVLGYLYARSRVPVLALRVGAPADVGERSAAVVWFDAPDASDEVLRAFATDVRARLGDPRSGPSVGALEDFAVEDQAPSDVRPHGGGPGSDPRSLDVLGGLEDRARDAGRGASRGDRGSAGLGAGSAPAASDDVLFDAADDADREAPRDVRPPRGVGAGSDPGSLDALGDILTGGGRGQRRGCPPREGIGAGDSRPPLGPWILRAPRPTSSGESDADVPRPSAGAPSPSAGGAGGSARGSPVRRRGALALAAWHAAGVFRGLASMGRGLGRHAKGLGLRRDAVDCSVFAPPRTKKPSTVLVQVFLHVPERRGEARALAEDADPGATQRGTQALTMRLRRGTVVTVKLEGAGLPPEGRRERVRYDGRTTSATFFVPILETFAGDAWAGRATVLVGDPEVPVGRICFRIAIDATSAPSVETGVARPYRHAFLSYASPDRPEVSRRARSLSQAGIKYFQDVLSLEPGERWRARLRREIESADLFVLFWSEAASRSDWVGWEIDEALARKAGVDENPPDIVPFTVGAPAPPPARLAHLHFGPPERWAPPPDADGPS